MELLGNKLRKLIKSQYKTLKEFYEKLVELHGNIDSINRFTLTRILKNKSVISERSLLQISNVLMIGPSALRKGTDQENTIQSEINEGYKYNDKAQLKILRKDLPFIVKKLNLVKGGKTDSDFDSDDKQESLKWVYILIGKVNVIVKEPGETKKFSLHRGQEVSFDARNPHHIENVSGKNSVCLIIHFPAENSIFFSAN